jgi:general stress protein CsbA
VECFVIDFRALLRATFVGVVIQIVMIGGAHFFPGLRAHYYLFALMMIAATSGYIYAADTGRGFFVGATAGAITGGICGFAGIAASAILHDVPQSFIPLDTAICVLTGAVGGLWGQVSANMKRAGW